MKDLYERGWDYLDFVLVTGDAYVDHPSFGAAIISRVLESRGYRIGIISQPDWRQVENFTVLGRPRLAFLVTAGNMDSMVSNYTAARKRRKKDAYSPGGVCGLRPNRATIVYTSIIKGAYKKIPVILGGIEASLRRLAHYDYWEDKLRRSILLDSRADMIVYGMGEKTIIDIADKLADGIPIGEIRDIRGIVYKTKDRSCIDKRAVFLPENDLLKRDKANFARSFKIQYENSNYQNSKTLVERYENDYVVQTPPPVPLTQKEMDGVYELSYTREFHPAYQKAGGIPALTEVKFSLVSNRGCFGGCNFCALVFHQGRIIQTRSHKSLIKEAEKFLEEPDFKGYIHDVGGPTANFRQPACEKQVKTGTCLNRNCLAPDPCRNLNVSHVDYLQLLRKLRKIEGIKKVFIRSGIRFDYLIADKNNSFFKELVEYHISGQLKVAPEHISSDVLRLMGKPGNKAFNRFRIKFKALNEMCGKKQFLVPYFISGHPGATLKNAVELAEYLRANKINVEQVQDFSPTPGTVSTCMYYTGVNPLTLKKVFVPVSLHEKAMQRALLQYKNPGNYKLVLEALIKANRKDLIGFSKNALIRPESRFPDNKRKSTIRKWKKRKR